MEEETGGGNFAQKKEQTLFKRSPARFDKILVDPQSSNRIGVLKNDKHILKGKLMAKRVAI